jgi:hypothetical protein
MKQKPPQQINQSTTYQPLLLMNHKLQQLKKQEKSDAQEKTSAHLNLTSNHQPTNSH